MLQFTSTCRQLFKTVIARMKQVSIHGTKKTVVNNFFLNLDGRLILQKNVCIIDNSTSTEFQQLTISIRVRRLFKMATAKLEQAIYILNSGKMTLVGKQMFVLPWTFTKIIYKLSII